MQTRSYSSEGIILGRASYSEADRIISLFSKDYGKITLLAKGVRKLQSRKRGHIEVFNRVKFSATKGKGLDILTEAEEIESYRKIRSSLKKVSLAYYFTEIIARTAHDGEANRSVYDLLCRYLIGMENQRQLKKYRLTFLTELLILLGYWPRSKPLINPDLLLEEVMERKPNSLRVGKRLLV